MTTKFEDQVPATREELLEILFAASGVPAAVLDGAPDASLSDLGLDSLAALELQAAVQDRFQVTIPDDALAMTFPEVTRFVAERADGTA
jgi:acyl carrier protein